VTILDTVTIADTAPQASGLELTHEVCCVDQGLAMCGTAIPGADWTEVEPVSCIVCAELLEQWVELAGRFGDDLEKPGARTCRLCPKRQRGEGR
jgi:hypothetical protein